MGTDRCFGLPRVYLPRFVILCGLLTPRFLDSSCHLQRLTERLSWFFEVAQVCGVGRCALGYPCVFCRKAFKLGRDVMRE